MRIVDKSDYTITVMKDSEDPYWSSLGQYARNAKVINSSISICFTHPYAPPTVLNADDFVCGAGRLILYFGDRVPDSFSVGKKVYLTLNKFY